MNAHELYKELRRLEKNNVKDYMKSMQVVVRSGTNNSSAITTVDHTEIGDFGRSFIISLDPRPTDEDLTLTNSFELIPRTVKDAPQA